MSVITGKINKPIDSLTAKVGSEAPAITMEAANLPEKYRKRVKKNLCIVSVAKPAEKTSGGVILAPKTMEASEYAAQIGRIEAVGPMFYNKKRYGEESANAPKVGEFVLFEPYVGRRLKLNGDMFMFIEDVHIMMDQLDDTDDFNLFT